MNVITLNNRLQDNMDEIVKILETVGMSDIHPNPSKQQIRCSREAGRNPSSVCIDIHRLSFICFSTGEKGSLYSLIMNKLDISFPESLRTVAKILNIDQNFSMIKVRQPFNGFYKNITMVTQNAEIGIPAIPDEVIEKIPECCNMLFFKDGINFQSQTKYHLGYDAESNRITIPQWDTTGNIVGIMGRLNEENAKTEQRWFPVYPCPRSKTLFGYHQNYKHIQNSGICIIVESEKGVMQLDSMGYKYGLATCGCNISKVQEQFVKALNVETVIVAYDQGLEESHIINESSKLLILNNIYHNKVGYIYDKNGDVLSLSKKESPTDLGKEVFEKLINEYTHWINADKEEVINWHREKEIKY